MRFPNSSLSLNFLTYLLILTWKSFRMDCAMDVNA
jgi:hypothetical protein